MEDGESEVRGDDRGLLLLNRLYLVPKEEAEEGKSRGGLVGEKRASVWREHVPADNQLKLRSNLTQRDVSPERVGPLLTVAATRRVSLLLPFTAAASPPQTPFFHGCSAEASTHNKGCG